jgi:PAS domain S-box-containing protein
VAVLDANGLLLSCNRSCEDVTGYTTREVHGKRIEDIFLTGQNAIAWSQVVEGILSGTSPGIHESTWTTRAGEKKRISWSFSVLSGPDRRLRYVVCTGTDITERDQLQKQLGRRVDELARVNLRLAEVNKELDSFAYAVSHDLRTPLRGMEGMAYALLDSVSSSLDEKDREFARRIAGSARQMDTLVQDLLAYSRVNQDQIQLERVELDLVVTDVLGKLQDTIDREQAEVAVLSPLPTLTSHRAILLQVVENLMANAIKFVAPGKTAQVEIGARAKDGAMRLWVKDKGIGIEPKHHETIFQALERLHDIESYPGTGIGLALVRRGIERLGGRVGVESAPGEGSLFWVELPLKA